MFTQGFTLAGSSLKLMNIGEGGVVTALRNADDTVMRKLTEMGVLPGKSITLEQRFPRFVVKVGTRRFALDNTMIHSVYVRLVK